MVDWLFHHVEGFSDRREARKYASNLLKAGYIRHTVNKITFSEQCYYIFGDLCGSKRTQRSALDVHAGQIPASSPGCAISCCRNEQTLDSKSGLALPQI